MSSTSLHRKGLCLWFAVSIFSRFGSSAVFYLGCQSKGGDERELTRYSLGNITAFLLCPLPAEGTLATGGHLPNASQTSMPSSVIASSSGERSRVPVSDTRTASSVAGSSAPTLPLTVSLDVVLLPSSSAAEPGRQNDVSQSTAGLGELPTKLLPAFSPSISVPSPSPSASGGSCGFPV